MNAVTYPWDLDERTCPCDVHFNEWMAKQKLLGKTVYHFGSGAHHIVGLAQAGRNNHVISITASEEEFRGYVDLVMQQTRIARHYLCYFGDIYLTNPSLLPDFDIVTLFHLCEFFYANTATRAYGGMTDRKLLDLFTDKTRSGGHILFYTGSVGFDRARPIISSWERTKPVERVGEFKTLLLYRKR
jgi:hypothetical protein